MLCPDHIKTQQRKIIRVLESLSPSPGHTAAACLLPPLCTSSLKRFKFRAAAAAAVVAAVQQWLVQLKGHQQWNQGDTGSS